MDKDKDKKFFHFIFSCLIVWFIISILLGGLLILQFNYVDETLECTYLYNYSNKYNCEYILCLAGKQPSHFDMEFIRYNYYACTLEAEKDALSQFSLR